MKLCMRNPDGQPGWQTLRPNRPVWVWLNDQRVKECFAADDVAGVVWVPKKTSTGGFVVNEKGDEIELERLTGKVEIRLLQS